MQRDNLPTLPTLAHDVTEARIERTVEHLFDRADRMLMRGLATQEQYDAWSKRVNAWAEAQYRTVRA